MKILCSRLSTLFPFESNALQLFMSYISKHMLNAFLFSYILITKWNVQAAWKRNSSFLCLLYMDDSCEMYVASARNVTVFTCKVRGRGRLQPEETCGICHCQAHQPWGLLGDQAPFLISSVIKISSEAETQTG